MFLSVVDRDGIVVNYATAEAENSLDLYRAAATQARKNKGDVRQAIVDKETADKLLTQAHVCLVEGRRTTFDELMRLVVGEAQE